MGRGLQLLRVRPSNSKAPTIAANYFEQRNRCASLDLRAFPLCHFHLACPCLGVTQADLWLDEDVDGGCFVPRLPVVPHHPSLRPPPPLLPRPLQGASTAHATLFPGGLLMDVCHVLGGVGHFSSDGRKRGLGGSTAWTENKVLIREVIKNKTGKKRSG